MFLKLLPDQVPMFWDSIKLAMIRSNNLEDRYIDSYLINLLAALMSDRAACFVRLTDEKELIAVHIVRVVENEIIGKRSLISDAIYAFKKMTLDEWKENFKHIVEFAKVNRCANVIAWTNNERVVEIAEAIGAKETSRTLTLELGGSNG